MSSDNESIASSQISTISSKNLKPHISEQWEMNLIGNFLLTLYHKNVIGSQNEWICEKKSIRKEFQQFVTPELSARLKDVNGTDNIGTLLQRCDFLYNTPGGRSFYKLKSKNIFDFRNKKLSEQDKLRVNDDLNLNGARGPDDILRNLTENKQIPSLQVNYEIDEESPVHSLQYEGTTMQQRRPNYHPTNMSCFICQKDFPTMDGYEEHIQTHNDETEFEFTKELSRFDWPIFSLSYRLCKNSHHFCFTIECQTSDIVIEKIIIVQSRSMFYVHNMRVPYDMPENGIENFYVDSHLFAMFVEQPIILICYIKDSKDTRIIEEHHFMRSLEFPKVNFAIKPFRLPSAKTFSPKFKLPDYFPPLEIRDALNNDFIYEKLMQTSNEFRDYIRNGKILQPQTIGPTLTTLLHIEDMDTIKEYLNLLQQNVKLRGFGNNYSMRLRTNQGIHIENVLSLFDDVIITTRADIKSDSESLVKLILQNKDDMKTSDTYVGQIEDINSGRVSFKCYKKLDLQRSYTIIFRPSRLLLRYQYRAMELLPVVLPFLKKFLFPGQLLPKSLPTLRFELYNKNIYNNPEQLQAVSNIAEGPRNDATYIIFGPPGTGKTTTLVESILQVLKRDDTKILVTASSNSACDEVALRLCKTLAAVDMARAIVRIYAQSNEARMESIDDLLLEHSNMYSVHFYPDVEVLHQYRIVVCTMSVVAKLSTGKFGRLQNGGTLYTHLFIDEVAASTEVEALMAITSVLTPKSCLIIAGDHKQLGPIVKSKRAEEFNLAVSLMDRLLHRECYRVNTDTGDYDRTIQSRLRLNFRSHPDIVNLYSGMYYNHDLESKANIDDVSLVKDWHLAPNKDFPIIFHSIDGKCYSDNQSFSLYNSEEINIVMDYVKDIMYFGINGKPIRECDIGIISPYKKQYLRIREELNLRKWYQIETGSVENFQGKEKHIIIVSFVRSGTPTLGFLDSPRRLNVTLSRAKSLLILIGNSSTLSIHPDYDYIIKECQRHSTLIGKLHSRPESVPTDNNDEKFHDKTTKKLKDLKLENNNSSNKKNRRQRRGKEDVANNKGKKNEIDNNNDSDGDSDDDEQEEDNGYNDNEDNKIDNKPSTSKSSAKTDLPKVEKKQYQPPNAGEKSKSKKGNIETSTTNLEAYFNELPSVPNINETSTTPQPSKPPIHPFMMLQGQSPQTPPQQGYHQSYALQSSNLYNLNAMQLQLPHQYGPPHMDNPLYHMGQPLHAQMGSLMGAPQMRPNYNIDYQNIQLQWQHTPLQHQYLQQQQQKQVQLETAIANNKGQMLPPANGKFDKSDKPLTTTTPKKKKNTKVNKNVSETENARRNRKVVRSNNNTEGEEDDNGDDDDDDNDNDNDDETRNKETRSKTLVKPHLAHSMKKKNTNTVKINKNNLKIDNIKLVAQHNLENTTTTQTAIPSHKNKAAPQHGQVKDSSAKPKVLPLSQKQQNPPKANDPNSHDTSNAAVNNKPRTAKKPQQEAKKHDKSGNEGSKEAPNAELNKTTLKQSDATIESPTKPADLQSKVLPNKNKAAPQHGQVKDSSAKPKVLPLSQKQQNPPKANDPNSHDTSNAAVNNKPRTAKKPQQEAKKHDKSGNEKSKEAPNAELSKTTLKQSDATIESSTKPADLQSKVLPNKNVFPNTLNKPRVIASINPMVLTSGTNRAQISSTSTSTVTSSHASSIQHGTTTTTSNTVNASINSQYASVSSNRPTASVNVNSTLSQTSLPSGSENSQYSTSSLNRPASTVNINPTLRQMSTTPNVETMHTATSRNMSNVQRATSTSGENTGSLVSYTTSSSDQIGVEELQFNQPYRPVRSLKYEKQVKKDNCVIT